MNGIDHFIFCCARMDRDTSDDIITASGTTLLGADDKAGVAIVMTAARHLLANRDMPHGPIRIAFTPDEEIGRGVGDQLPKDLGADFAYTFDGGKLGEIEYETFSADGAEVVITGVSIHPGTACHRNDWRVFADEAKVYHSGF